MLDHDAPTLLGQVAKAQMACGLFGETEVGFWQRIAEAGMAGAR